METTVLTKTEALKKKAKGKKGFTLIELVVVIAILVIIAAIAVPTVSNIVNNANKSADESNRQAVEVALKNADSLIRTKQSSTLSPTSSVGDALKEGGIVDNTGSGKLPDLKATGDGWGYIAGGKIVLSGGTTFDTSTGLSTIFGAY